MLIYGMDITALLPLISAAYSGARTLSRDRNEMRVKRLPSGPLYFIEYLVQYLGREKLSKCWWEQSALSPCLFSGRLAEIEHPHAIQENSRKDTWEIKTSVPNECQLHGAAAFVVWSQSLQYIDFKEWDPFDPSPWLHILHLRTLPYEWLSFQVLLEGLRYGMVVWPNPHKVPMSKLSHINYVHCHGH